MTTKGEENFSADDYSSPFLVCFKMSLKGFVVHIAKKVL